MAIDWHISDSGDIAMQNDGDIAITQTSQEQIRQQAQLRLATQRGDFVPYPRLGGDLQRMIGKPNTVETARFGQKLIERTLVYDGFVPNGYVQFKDITPTAADTIVYDFTIPYGKKEYINLTLTQLLTVT